MDTKIFKIEEFMCPHCAEILENTLRSVHGVTDVKIDRHTHIVKLTGDFSPIDVITRVSPLFKIEFLG